MKHLKTYNESMIITDKEIIDKIVNPIKDILLELDDEGYQTEVNMDRQWIYLNVIYPKPPTFETKIFVHDVCDRIKEHIKLTGWYTLHNSNYISGYHYRIVLEPSYILLNNK